jgi:hypothetical protein
LAAIFYGAGDANSQATTQPFADRLITQKDNSDVGDTGLAIGKTPIELRDIVINSPVYSSYWGDSSMLGFGSAIMPTCFYDWTGIVTNLGDINDVTSASEWQEFIGDQADFAANQIQNAIPGGASVTAPLIVNNFMTSGKSREILFGISDLKYCPLPGSSIFSGYNQAVSGEFLLTGAICVINSILFDSMFKVYCTIIIWFYSIMYSMIIIYIMFYGMALMLGIGQDPIKEAPKKVIKIVILFMLVTNAQVGFRYVHTFFITALNSFSSMLSDLQTVTDDSGNDAYQGKLSEFYGALKSLGVSGSGGASNGNSVEDLFIKKGKLLNISGNVWRPLDLSGITLPAGVPAVTTVYSASDKVTPDNYVPFRLPNQQWQYTPSKTNGVVTYTIEPVYKPLLLPPPYILELKACALDFRYAPNNNVTYGTDGKPNFTDDKPWDWVIKPYLRCPKDNQSSIPYLLPYGVYCIYDPKIKDATPDTFTVGGPDNPVLSCIQGATDTQLIRLKNTPGNLTAKCSEIKNFFASIVSKTAAGAIIPKPCRSSFQGIFAKADALISGMVGGDRSKGIGGLLAAFATWSVGGGLFLSLFMMTGFLAVTFAAIQVVWTFVTAIMALSFLLMVSPIFISFLLFKTTEKLFRGWLNSVISFTLQPILILAFVFFISAITSVDKINYLMREELTSKTMVVGGAQRNAAVPIPGFIEPLYEKPEDFDTFYYDNGAKSDPASSLISAKQRDRYLEKKGKAVLEKFFMEHPKFGNGNVYKPNWVMANAGLQNKLYAEVMNLWDNGVYPIEMPRELNPLYYTTPNANSVLPNIRVSKYRGIKALQDYANLSGYISGGSAWFNVNHPVLIPKITAAYTAPYGTRVIDEILFFYTAGGCFIKTCDISASYPAPGPNVSIEGCYRDNNDLMECGAGEVHNGLVPGKMSAKRDTSIDDGDSFVGEPDSISGEYWDWGPGWQTFYRPKEYPVCRRFCPQFNPKYVPGFENGRITNTTKPWLANPNINTPPTTVKPDGTCPSLDVQEDGTGCPDLDNDGKPDNCYTPNCYGWKCEKYCMYIKDAQQVLYRDVLSNILAFIIINMVAATFLSKMPELASALSIWAPGQQAVKIGGGSKIMGNKDGGDAWTKSEMSDVYSVGGILNIDPQRPGTVLGIANKASALAGGYDKVNQDGSIYRVNGQGILGPINSGGLFGKAVSGAALEKAKAKALGDIKLKLGLDKNESMQNLKDPVKENILASFQGYRPAYKTNLTHAEIWRAANDILSATTSTNPDIIRQAIETKIQELIQKNQDKLVKKIPDKQQ